MKQKNGIRKSGLIFAHLAMVLVLVFTANCAHMGDASEGEEVAATESATDSGDAGSTESTEGSDAAAADTAGDATDKEMADLGDSKDLSAEIAASDSSDNKEEVASNDAMTDGADAAKADKTDAASAVPDQFAIDGTMKPEEQKDASNKEGDSLMASNDSMALPPADDKKPAAEEVAKNDAVPMDSGEAITPAPAIEGEKLAANDEPKQEDSKVSEEAKSDDEAKNQMKDEEPKSEAKGRPHRRHHRTVASATQLPSQIVERKGTSLNRFYYLRGGDTPELVSQRLYGTAAKAGDLESWNPGDWRTGQVVYYQSAAQPNDAEMKGFVEEGNAAAETYTIKPGDKLSTIAQEKYGDLNAWKEIAAENHINNPDMIVAGQTLTLYSLPTETASAAKVEEKAAEPVAQTAPVASPAPVAQANPVNPGKVEANPTVANQVNQPVAAVPAAGHDMAKEENPALIPQAKQPVTTASADAKGVDSLDVVDQKLKADVESRQAAAAKKKSRRQLASADDMSQVFERYFWVMTLGGLGLLFVGWMVTRRFRRARADSELLE